MLHDPTVETSVNEPAKIHDAHVSANYPTTNYDQSFLLKTGTGSLSGDNKTYISFDLPQLNASDLVIKAELSMALAVTNDVAAGQVDVQKVESSWNQSTITWNNKPSINSNSNVEDFEMVQGVWGQRFVWDITNIAKEWYATKVNNGLALSNHALSTGYNEYYSSNTGSTYENYRPFVKFTYVNSTGLEDYWTYETQSAGRAGTGHVNNYNGNLVFVHDDMQTTGYRLPVGISHIYNSISNFDESGKDIGYGPGWRLNLSQTIISETIGTKQYYTYTDEDGTKHYFDSSTYKDESGLNLSLTVEANSYKIEDNGGNMLIFNSDGKLSSIKDNNGNTITLEYFNGKLIKILDGATSSSITNLNYDANNRLQTIVDPNGRTTAYEYELTTNRLNKITYPDGEITTYSYDVKGNLTTVQNHDGYKIVYTYNSRVWIFIT